MAGAGEGRSEPQRKWTPQIALTLIISLLSLGVSAYTLKESIRVNDRQARREAYSFPSRVRVDSGQTNNYQGYRLTDADLKLLGAKNGVKGGEIPGVWQVENYNTHPVQIVIVGKLASTKAEPKKKMQPLLRIYAPSCSRARFVDDFVIDDVRHDSGIKYVPFIDSSTFMLLDYLGNYWATNPEGLPKLLDFVRIEDDGRTRIERGNSFGPGPFDWRRIDSTYGKWLLYEAGEPYNFYYSQTAVNLSSETLAGCGAATS
jgi:hypothetical protein